MADELKTVIFDAATKETIERPMTPDELATYQAFVAAQQAQQNELDAKAAARESALAKLAALGLTEAEIAAL
jgi:DNA-binding NarL/FixJ family response regulator